MATAQKAMSLCVASSASSQAITKAFFGADCNNGFGSQFSQPALIDGLGNPAVLQTIRLWDNGLKWAQIQKSENSYDFTQLLKWVKAAQAENYDLIYTFGSVPTFIASTTGGSGCSNVPGQINTCCPPTDVNSDGSGTDATFKGFVTALINAVGAGVIKYYELWNEQDSPNFWNGSMQQAVRMGQDAAAIIRSLDPSAQILSPSFHGPTAATFFQSYCTTEVNGIYGWQNFDIVNVHMRASDVNEEGNKNANVDPTCFFTPYNQVISTLDSLQSVNKINLTSYPLWDDEHGYLPNQGGEGYPPAITDAYVQAAYVAISTIVRASVNLQKQVYYCWTSSTPAETLQSNSSGTAWNTVANILIGKQVNGCLPNTNYSQGNSVYGSPIYRITIDGGMGMFVFDMSQTCSEVNGKESCTYSTFSYPNGYTQWADIFGNTGNLSGGTVSIGCCPLYLF